MKLQAKDKAHEIISLNNLWVRNATLFDGQIHLELSPSSPDVVNYLNHINKLDASGCFSVDISVDMFERLISPDEVGTRDHKLAQLPGNCIDLRIKLDDDNGLLVVDGGHDSTYILASDEKSGFKPSPRFSRLFRDYSKNLARAHVFSGVQSFFKGGNGSLVPTDQTQPLVAYQRNLVQILTPYSKHFCDDPTKVRDLNVSKVDGQYLGVEQRMNSIMEVVDLEESFMGKVSSSPLYGKVTLQDILGNPQDTTWEVESRKHLDSTLRNSRLTYAVGALNDHIKSKLIPNIGDQISKALSRPLTAEQKAEVSSEFNRFLANIVDASQKRLEPLRKFERMMGHSNEGSPELGLAVLNHLAELNRMKTPLEYQLSDGTKLDFSAAVNKLFADPRIFGAPLEKDPKMVKQAANSVLLNYVSRELSSSYWGITAPTPGVDSIDALLNINKFKATEHFTTGKSKVADVDSYFDSFREARNLLVNQVEEYSGYALDKTMATPPKLLLHKFLERSEGNADVTRSRGLLLQVACMLFKKAPIADEKVDALLREADMLAGKAPGTFAEGVQHVTRAYVKSRPEAAFALLLHEAISQHNVQLAAKLQQFGEESFPDFKNILEDALDSRVRARSLTVDTLGKRASESPADVCKALNPQSTKEMEETFTKASIVSNAAMRVLKDTLQSKFANLSSDLLGGIKLDNLERTVFNGPQAHKMMEEQALEAFEEEWLSYVHISSIRDPLVREQTMRTHAMDLNGTVDKSKSALEVEVDTKCYPAGQSPRRAAKAMLKEGVSKALMGLGGGGGGNHGFEFAPPGVG